MMQYVKYECIWIDKQQIGSRRGVVSAGVCRWFAAKARMGATHFLSKTLPKVAAEKALSAGWLTSATLSSKPRPLA
jgi:hypothetical protein